MKLSFPLSSELLTLDFITCKALEQELRRQHDLSILQYRAMSLMQQGENVRESMLIDVLDANASQLSQNLSKLAKRGCASSVSAGGSAKSWMLTKAGRAVLDDADITLIQVYNRYFEGLNNDVMEGVRFGLRLTSQSHGVIRVKDEGFFDEQSFFESVLPIVQIVIKSLQPFDLSPVQFRIMFELLSQGPALKAHLAEKLFLTRSTVSWACETLTKRDLLHFAEGATSKANPVSLTESGRVVTARAAEHVDRAWCEMRVWSPDEKRYYQKSAEYLVGSFARKRSL